MARSLKTKYCLTALAVGTVLALLLAGVAYYEHRVDTADINQLTHAAVEQKLEADLEARAGSIEQDHRRLAGSGAARSTNKIGRIRRSPSACSRSATSSGSRCRMRTARCCSPAAMRRTAHAPAAAPFSPQERHPGQGARASQAGGTLEDLAEPRQDAGRRWRASDAQMENRQGHQVKTDARMVAGVTLPLIRSGLVGAWFIARQLSRPIIGAGQVGGPDRRGRLHAGRWRWCVATSSVSCKWRSSACGKSCAETTITKNYLNTVLNSLSDAVLVTSSDGVVKSCNEAAQRLLGYRKQTSWASR